MRSVVNFHAVFEKGFNSKGDALVKGFVSLNNPDRSEDIVTPESFNIKRFLENPQLWYNHKLWKDGKGNEIPVGQIEEAQVAKVIDVKSDTEWGIADLAGKEIDRFSKSRGPDLHPGLRGLWTKARITVPEVVALIEKGDLNAFSWKGFASLARVILKGVEKFITKTIDLMEVSLVFVPDNYAATFEIAKGVCLSTDIVNKNKLQMSGDLDTLVVQSLLFSDSLFGKKESGTWLVGNGFSDSQIAQVGDEFIAIQKELNQFESPMLSMHVATGIQAIVGKLRKVERKSGLCIEEMNQFFGGRLIKGIETEKGGSGSGNFGHGGRPGEVGGSGGGGGRSLSDDEKADNRAFSKINNDLNRSITRYKEKIAANNQAIADLQSNLNPSPKIQALQAVADKANKEYLAAKTKREEAEARLAATNQRIADLKKQLAAYKKSNESDLEEQLKKALAERKALISVFQGIADEMERIADSLDAKKEIDSFLAVIKGGVGSGSHGHGGRPGQIGGSVAHHKMTRKQTPANYANVVPFIETMYKCLTSNNRLAEKGGPGSGNFGHAGRYGLRGGSAAAEHTPINPSASTSEAAYTDSNGKWTKERAEHQQKWKDSKQKGVEPVEGGPVVNMLGGGSASGKGVMKRSNPGIPKKNVVDVDSDDYKNGTPDAQRIKALDDLEERKKANAFVHGESSDVAKDLVKDSLRKGLDTVFDGTGDGGIDQLTAKIEGLRANGAKKVIANYATVPVSKALERNQARFETERKWIPEDYIKQVYSNIPVVVPQAVAAGLFDEFTLWDTNVTKGQNAVKIAVQDVDDAGKKYMKVLDQKKYDAFLNSANL